MARTESADPNPLDTWEGIPVERLRAAWSVPELRVLGTTTSTNDDARMLADAGAPHGTTVIAEHQTAGRGRHGRIWSDRPSASLLLSIVLHPAEQPAGGSAPAEPAVLPLLVGLACARAIRAVTGIDVGIEWPNDLVVDDLKLGGILCESVLRAGAVEFVIAGIGLNAAAVPADLTADVSASSTSIASALAAIQPDAAPPARAELAGEVVRRVALLRADSAFSTEDLQAIRDLDALAGRPVRLGTGREGLAVGILPDGAFAVDDSGEPVIMYAGSVTPIGPRAR